MIISDRVGRNWIPNIKDGMRMKVWEGWDENENIRGIGWEWRYERNGIQNEGMRGIGWELRCERNGMQNEGMRGIEKNEIEWIVFYPQYWQS